MRTLVVATVFGVVALAGGCTGDSEPRGSDARPSAGTSGTSEPVPDELDGSDAPDVPVVDSAACEEVRIGIAAFNSGDFDGTVEHFEAALPLAQEQDDGSTMASQLIEAVRYYAALDAGLYPEAARSSPEFAKYKAITLGQCMPIDGEVPESPGSNV